MKISSPALSLATAAPDVITFPNAQAVGVSVLAARSDHAHLTPSTWTKVAAGVLGAVASLNLTGLSGYKRYRLHIHYRHGGGAGQVTLKLNNGASNLAIFTHNATGVITGVMTATGATCNLGGAAQASNAGVGCLDLLVTHDDQSSDQTGFLFAISRTGQGANNMMQATGGGCEQTAVASITEMLIAFGLTITDGNYAIYGSLDVS